MKPLILVLFVLLGFASGARAQTAPDAAEITKLLKDFLAGASRDDGAMHDRFWADDLIYTGSSGRRIGKSDIMRDARSTRPARKPGDPLTVYTAEDIRIQQYGNTAIVAFRLVAVTESGNSKSVANYYNTGTFLKRNDKWQAVSWQATRIPRSAEDAQKEVAAIESGFHKAILAADIKALESLLDPGFVWTHDNGQQVTGKQLLEQLGSGRLKYSLLETSNVTISVSGDTAIARGATSRQRSSIPDSASGDAKAFTAYYTLTMVNSGGAWKAVAMHTSRP